MGKLKGYYCTQAGCNRFATEGIAKRTWIAKFTGKDGKAHGITCSTCLKKFNPLLINHESGEVIEPTDEQLRRFNGEYSPEQLKEFIIANNHCLDCEYWLNHDGVECYIFKEIPENCSQFKRKVI